MYIEIIGTMLIVTACISKAISDKIQFHYSRSVFKIFNPLYWNPELSWVNKWMTASAREEKFLGSSTIFVVFTDAMHFFNMVYGVCLFTGASLIGWNFWWLTIGSYIFGKIIFEIMFRYVLDNG